MLGFGRPAPGAANPKHCIPPVTIAIMVAVSFAILRATTATSTTSSSTLPPPLLLRLLLLLLLLLLLSFTTTTYQSRDWKYDRH